MKFLENFFQKHRQDFEEGGKNYKWRTFYETFFNFAFTPDTTTQKGSHIRDCIDLKRTMFFVVIALIPTTLFGMWNLGFQHYIAIGQESGLWENFWFGLLQSLPMILVSYGVGLGIEFLFGMLRAHSLHEGFLVSGMLIPLTMPADVPLWMVGVATAFAVIIGKEIFGGTGMNIINIALTARAFLFFAYPTSMTGDKVWMAGTETTKVDGFTGSTALGDLATFMSDKPVFQNLNGFTSEYTLSESFIGMIPGSVGETSTLACLIGAGILLITGVGSLRIMASFFVGGLAMGLLLNLMGGNPYLELPAIYHLVIGSFAFGAIFMATDPVSAAQTAKGKLVYGFLGGLLAILIRVLNPAYPEGVMLAILFMNISAPIIDYYVIQGNINRRLKRIKTA